MSKRLTIGDQAPSGVVLDINGKALQLEALWQQGPTLLTFLRHFG